MNKQILDLLGPDAQPLLTYKAKGFSADKLHLPGGDFVSRVLAVLAHSYFSSGGKFPLRRSSASSTLVVLAETSVRHDAALAYTW